MRAERITASSRKALGVFLAIALFTCRRQESPSEHLRALAPRSERPIEARLSGFDWQAIRLQRAAPSGLMDPSRLDLAGAASTVIQSFRNNPSPRARHESGAAYLLIDHDRDAIDALESAVRQSPNDASYWSDLAAARYTHAVREKRPHELPQALADADHALHLAPALPDALFNRALIIEALGITEAARRAWQSYVAVDSSTHWSSEATSHIGRLRVATSRDDFQRQLSVASRAKRRGDDAPLVALARNYPQQARTWSEGPLLGIWADAVRAGKTKAADETLAVVRVFGSALAEINHDDSIHDAVAAIDRAAADPVRFRTLAEAQGAYRDARLLYRDRRIADAQRGFREAAELFAQGDSPMALAVDYYLAGCLFSSSHPVEAKRALDELATRFDHARYPALWAELGWEQTLCQSAAGDLDAAIRTASSSRKVFASLGEDENRCEMDLLLAANLNRASQPGAAWKARIAAFPVLSRAGSYDRIRGSLVTAMNSEGAEGNSDAALALAQIALGDLRQVRQPTVAGTAEAARAEVLAAKGDTIAARSAIRRARAAAKELPNTALPRGLSASIDIAEAMVERKANPSLSRRLLDSVIAFFTSEHTNARLPKAYLERGKTRALVGDDAGALSDFESGLREIETQRAAITSRDLRGTFYDTAHDLFSEAIALKLRDRDPARAFEFSDAARAAGVYEQTRSGKAPLHATTEQLRSAIPPRTALIEYDLLPDSIVIFYFSPAGFGVARIPVNQAAVSTLVERYVDSLQHRSDAAEVNRQSAALYRLLIGPVSTQLAGIDRLVIVPDRQFHTIPWAALYNPGRGHYLVDDFAISVAPSASTILQKTIPLSLAPVLVVGDPHDGDMPALADASHEAEAIAALYRSSTLLEGERATRERFLAAVLQSGMIHYAGHAESDSADPFGALHLAADRPRATGDLDTSAIAALHLSKAPLVILAACGTIRGESQHVEGMPSIARAFLAAGARSVIGTLWEVDDDVASALFRHLHTELHNGATPSSALRTAQLALAHDPNPRLSHPATWAPVELLGYTSEQAASRNKRSE
jgi:CHAT domain-containing protein